MFTEKDLAQIEKQGISLETIPVFIFALLVAMLVVYLFSMKRTNQLKLVPAAESQPAD